MGTVRYRGAFCLRRVRCATRTRAHSQTPAIPPSHPLRFRPSVTTTYPFFFYTCGLHTTLLLPPRAPPHYPPLPLHLHYFSPFHLNHLWTTYLPSPTTCRYTATSLLTDGLRRSHCLPPLLIPPTVSYLLVLPLRTHTRYTHTHTLPPHPSHLPTFGHLHTANAFCVLRTAWLLTRV